MQGLAVKDVYTLYSLIDREESTFHAISEQFRRELGSQDALKLGLGLLSLLHECDLLPKPTQRLICVFLLGDFCGKDGQPLPMAENPFLVVLLKLLNHTAQMTQPSDDIVGGFPELTKQEKYFLAHLINGTARDLLLKTAKQIMALDIPVAPKIDTTYLESAVVEMQSRFPLSVRSSLPNLFRCPDQNAAKNLAFSEQQAALQSLVDILHGPDPAGYQTFRPKFLRLAPPIHFGENEYLFLHPTDMSQFVPQFIPDMLDPSDGDEASPDSSPIRADSDGGASSSRQDVDVAQLMAKAMTEPLLKNEVEQLASALKNGPSTLELVDMKPDNLPKLVEENPLIAVEVLNILAVSYSDKISPYFEELLRMGLSVHGMEVVNRLTSVVDIPEEFLHLYVAHCISQCEKMKDPQTQHRLVRMVCVFLSSLIRNRLINVKVLHIELSAFCVAFSTVREAAALFQTVQIMEKDGVDAAAAIPSDL